MLAVATRRALLRPPSCFKPFRPLKTLSSNPHIYSFQDNSYPSTHLLTLLPTDPPNERLAIGKTKELPPSSRSVVENPQFMAILNSVMSEHAYKDPGVIAQAATLASQSGSALLQPGRRPITNSDRSSDQDNAGTTGGGRGGWVHVSDERNPPVYGRIAEPEDIFGSLEVDETGQFVNGSGNFQPSGTYRICTKEGVLGLSDFLRQKLVSRLEMEEGSSRP